MTEATAPLPDSACAHMPLRAWLGEQRCVVYPLGAGHINATYLVRTADGGPESEAWVLQGLSTAVFQRPAALMQNLQRFSDWLAAGGAPNYALPLPVPARDGATLVAGGPDPVSGEPGVWRLTPYVRQSRTLQQLENTAQAAAAGRAFGELQFALRDQSGADLVPVIDGFLDLPSYLSAFDEVLVKHAERAGRAAEQALVRALTDRRLRYDLPPAGAEKTVIHGDCKVNNLLFAEARDEVLAIVDLDTLMVGSWWLDYGDLVRSATLTGDARFAEDLFVALARGFFAGRAGLQARELASALAAPAHLAYMLSLRFLTDHLEGDRYFNVTSRGENLHRAELQFAQLQLLERAECQNLMHSVLQEIVKARI